MKFYILILTLLFFSGCASQAKSVSEVGKTAQPTPQTGNSNSNANSFPSYADYQYDKDLLDKLNAENERFRQIPAEFESVDFKNFKCDFGRLKKGKFEKEYSKKYAQGGESYTFDDVFYIDLIGDEKKEAVVFLYTVSCGGSCDGGANLIYFYSSNNGKAKLIDAFETGSNSGGCSLKSFTIKDKKIYVEQFGRCDKNSNYEEGATFVCKFCTKDETHSIYSFTNNKLKRDSIEIIETKIINIMNSPAFVGIND